MKLELVMLATVFSMITERQVEAQVRCYENKDFTGKKATINNSIQNLTSLFPNGARACNVTAKSVLIFYSEPEYRGEIIAVNGDDTEIVPRYGFSVKSLFVLANPTLDGGLLLFKEENFQGGLVQSFNSKTENVRGNITFGSAVVLGDTLDWTAVRRCRLVDSNGQCFVCLRGAKSRASFIRRIASTGMWETEAIFPGACAGTNYAGESSIHGEKGKLCYQCEKPKSLAHDLTNCTLVQQDTQGRPCHACGYSDYIPYDYNGVKTRRFCEVYTSWGDEYWEHEGRLSCYCKYDRCNENGTLCKSKGTDLYGK